MKKHVRVYENKHYKDVGYSNRRTFSVVEYFFNYEEDKDFIDKVIEKATALSKKVNSKGANTSVKRDDKTKLIDNIAGFFAERISVDYYNSFKSKDTFYQKESTSSFHQIDVQSTNGKKVEIRSSFVHNFPDTALFKLKTNADFEGQGAYNIPCTYTNDYKRADFNKDFYTFIAFVDEKDTFLDVIKKEFKVFVVGTATKKEVTSFGGKTSMKTNGKTLKQKSDYCVVPIHKSLSYSQLSKVMEEI